jgi:hypothetical protein
MDRSKLNDSGLEGSTAAGVAMFLLLVETGKRASNRPFITIAPMAIPERIQGQASPTLLRRPHGLP